MAINRSGWMGNHSNGDDGSGGMFVRYVVFLVGVTRLGSKWETGFLPIVEIAVGILRNVMWWASSLHYFPPLLLSIMGAEIKCKYQSL